MPGDETERSPHVSDGAGAVQRGRGVGQVLDGGVEHAADAVVVRRLTVHRRHGVVLPGLDLTIARGSLTGLLGPSGSGKTTLLRCLVGVQEVQSGDVTVLGRPAGAPGLWHRVAYMAQGGAIYGDLSVAENLQYVARVVGASSMTVQDVVERVDMTRHLRSRVDALSGGERTRVSLAMALVGRPEVLILDEPTVGLDPVLRRDLWQLFRSLTDEGATLIVSSHVMDEAERCERLVLMRDGRVLAHGTPEAILRSTGQDTVEAAFLSLIEAGAA